MKNQVAKIQAILKNSPIEPTSEIMHFSPDEKCTAIASYVKHAELNFDLGFVESVHDYYLRFGKCTNKQIGAIDKIISGYKIDVGRWAL